MRPLRVFTGLVGTFALSISVSAFTAHSSVRTVVHEELVAELSSGCSATCSSRGCATTAEHKNLAGGSTHGGGVHGCLEVALQCDYHACAVSNAPSRIDLERLIANGQLETLIETVHRKNLSYVPERGVVQLLADCGSVIAQLPATPLAIAALSTE